MKNRAIATCTAAVAAALLSCAVGARASMTPIAGDPVDTTGGKVAGTRLPSGVRAYLGIPFAKPPTQALRWRAPQPMAWSGIWNADRLGPECIQILRPHKINHYFGEEPTSENCLYLNVWTPPNAAPGAKLPVVVFIYGGGGTVGSSGPALYSGAEVARHGAIFVNFNYRVGILGYMAHPELSREQGGHSGNYGYLDQNAALKWIHDNIAAFGGDPSKVLISGQSAGARSVAAQLNSPLSKGLFRAGAMWSGCNFTFEPVPLAKAEEVGLEIQKRLGATDLEAMRDAPADKILALQEEHQLGANVSGLRLPATLDGYFWTADPKTMLATHQFSTVPIIASSNGDDIDSNASPLTAATTVAEYKTVAQQMFGPDTAEFLRLYPVNTDADVREMARKAAREGGLLAGSRTCAALEAKSNGTPAYVDLFAHKHPYVPGVKIADQDPETVGAYHTSDVPYWFGTFDAFNLFRPTRNWTSQDDALSQTMMDALIAMAETGDPSTPRLHWPAWSSQAQPFVLFSDTAHVETLNTTGMDWLAAHPPAKVERQGPGRTARD
jgi:para-nitrobenzyl esterase